MSNHSIPSDGSKRNWPRSVPACGFSVCLNGFSKVHHISPCLLLKTLQIYDVPGPLNVAKCALSTVNYDAWGGEGNPRIIVSTAVAYIFNRKSIQQDSKELMCTSHLWIFSYLQNFCESKVVLYECDFLCVE